MGVSLTALDKDYEKALGIDGKKGAFVAQIFLNSPAAKGGIQAGDFIIALNGKNVKDVDQLVRDVGDLRVGETADFTVIRGGKEIHVSVKIEGRDDSIVTDNSKLWPGFMAHPITEEIRKEMKLDNIVAERLNKTIYRDGDHAIKVFDVDYSKADVLNEALNQARVEETGLNIPKALEVSKIDGRWAIVSEYISGKTLEALMAENPEKEDEYLELFVDLQMKVHTKTCPLLTKLKDKMNRKISLADLVDVYTGSNGTTVDVAVSNQNVISASVHDIKDAHIASDAAIAKSKLASDVQASLGKADSALQEHQNISHLATKSDVATEFGKYTTTEALTNLLDKKVDKTTYDAYIAGKSMSDAELKTYADGVAATAKNEAIEDAATKYQPKGEYQPAGSYATAEQGAKADSALQTVEATTGLKVSTKSNNKQTISIDDEVVFVFNCNYDASYFYFGGNRVSFEPGMQWSQFINSSYNTIGAQNPVGPVITVNASSIYGPDGEAVQMTDTIIGGAVYTV